MCALQNKKKTRSLALALIPAFSMLLLLIIDYGNMGLGIEPLLLCSAAVAAGIACQGYCREDIINAIVDKLAKAMPVLMILIGVVALIGTWMFSGTLPYMVYWGLKLISPEYIFFAAFFLTSMVSVCTGTSWGAAGTVGVVLLGVAACLDVSLAAATVAVISGAYFGDKISPLFDSTRFAALVADITLFEHIQHLRWTPLPSFLLAAVVYLIAGHSNMLGEVATPQHVTDTIHFLQSLYHFNIALILPPAIVLWGAIRKKPGIPLMLSACVLALFLGVIMQGPGIKQGPDAFMESIDIAMFPQSAEGVVAVIPRLLNRGGCSMKQDFIVRRVDEGAGILLPMWVSDFVFTYPPQVQAALYQSIKHEVSGYSERDKAYFGLSSRRHRLVLKQKGYYGPFAKIITLNGRTLLAHPLSESPAEGDQMDFCQLERLFRHEHPPLMILYNPHNPTGRCGSANELERLLLLCEAYDVTLIPNEIWGEWLLPGKTPASVLHWGERWYKRVISATAASKTFGLPSLQIAHYNIPAPTHRQRFLSRLEHSLDAFNARSVQAAEKLGSGFTLLHLECSRTYLKRTMKNLKRLSGKMLQGIPAGG